jgi:hypothetical protein
MKITTVDPFPAGTPELKLPRSSEQPPLDPAQLAERAAALEAERRRIEEDSEALRLREANLREYEARLRAVQNDMDSAQASGRSHSVAPFSSRSTAPFASRSSTPFPSDAALEAAWQKVHRAREISAAEQAHLRDDRIAMHAFEAELKEREAAVAAREARVAELEKIIAETSAASEPKRDLIPGPKTVSAFTRLTRAPFLMAENVLRGKKDDEPAKPTE